jgi:hypothetical protein
MATFVEQIDAVIATLNAAKEDASTFDGGKTGLPGTRLRKAATDSQKALGAIKKGVGDTRNAAKAAKAAAKAAKA